MMTTASSISKSALFDVTGLVAVVTGGGTGIGLMMAKALEANGATVYIVGRRSDVLEKAAEENNKHGKIIPMQGDVTSKDSLQQIVKTIEEQTGYINLLVNNSGISGATYFDRPKVQTVKEFQEYFWNKATPTEFTEVFHVNVTGVWFTTLAFLSLLEAGNQKGRGIEDVSSQIVTTSSVGGYRRDGYPTSTAYQTSKAAATHMGKLLANMLRDYDIRSNVIAPGLFESEMTAGMLRETYPRDFIPAQRPGNEQEMGGLILFLASRAGAYTNGNVSLIDGGRLGNFSSTY